MTHTAEHVIIHKATQPVSFADPASNPAPGNLKVWHVGLALLVVGFIAGAWIF